MRLKTRTITSTSSDAEESDMPSSFNRLRVGFISQWFPPEPAIVPANIFDAIAKHFDVVAITGQPNYPEGVLHEGFKAGATSYAIEFGRKVRRTPLYPDHSVSAIGRVLNYCSWALSATVFARREVRRSDVNFVYASPIMAALPAMVARAIHGVPFVLNIQDLWPDSVFATGFIRNGPLRKIAEWSINRFANISYRMASAVITISPGMAQVLELRGVDPSKIHLVYNWADESTIDNREVSTERVRSELGVQPNTKMLIYAGNIGAAQELHHLIGALSVLAAEDQLDCHLVIIGDGVELPHIKSMVRDLSLEEHVSFLGRIPSTEVPRFLASADASVVSLGDSPLFRHTMPSKVQSILACGSPIFVIGEGDVADVAVKSGAGWATSSDRESLVRELRKFSADRQDRGRRAAATSLYHGEMSKRIGTEKLATILRASAN